MALCMNSSFGDKTVLLILVVSLTTSAAGLSTSPGGQTFALGRASESPSCTTLANSVPVVGKLSRGRPQASNMASEFDLILATRSGSGGGGGAGRLEVGPSAYNVVA